jgi:dihydropteroate synthase
MDYNLQESSRIEDIAFPTKITLNIKGKLFLLDRPWVMGILNLTPDSFFAKSRISKGKESAVHTAESMLKHGADVLDIGGYSSRPGASHISEKEELDRTINAIFEIKKEFPECLISIDTFRSKVAQEAVNAGADLVNDISAGTLDETMMETVGLLNVPYIAMHMRGNPQTMTKETDYQNIILELTQFFSSKKAQCIKAGIKDVIIDPGFGFAKRLEQSYWILQNLSYFKSIQSPILVGVSRKSMIFKKLEITPDEALNGTTALNMYALTRGANILRVHDVKEAIETVSLYKQLNP